MSQTIPAKVPNDSELLAAFLDGSQEEAFGGIVRRHGELVLRVCRSVLGNTADAEDAAQAVFLTLAHKASSLRGHATLAGWLHKVAWFVAARAAEAAAIRRRHEQEAARMKSETSRRGPVEGLSEEALHAALEKLPEKYRLPLLLHHLEGRTEEETAALLGCSVGAASVRLVRGRQMLRERMAKGGAAVTAVAVVAALTGQASAGVSAVFVSSTAKMAMSLAAGNAASAAASPVVMALTKGAMKMLWTAKMKVAAALAVAFAVLGGFSLYVGAATAAKGVVSANVGVKESSPASAPAVHTKPAGGTVLQHIHYAPEVPGGADIAMNGTRLPMPELKLDRATMEIMPPLAIYVHQMGRGLAGVQSQGRLAYFVRSGGVTVAEANIAMTNGAARLGSYGGMGRGEADPIAELSKLDVMAEVKGGNFEVRLLMISRGGTLPAYTVIWLKSDAGGKDLVYLPALAQAVLPEGLKMQTLYGAEAFFNLLEEGEVSGTVVDAEGKPVAGAHVTLNYSFPGAGPRGETTSDAQGAFTVRARYLGKSSYVVTVTAGTLAGTTPIMELAQAAKVKLAAPVKLESVGRVPGTALDKEGKAAATLPIP